MAKKKIDAFENKISNTYNAIKKLELNNQNYQKQADYSQLMITTSSVFSDIGDILSSLTIKAKNKRIAEYEEKLVNIGVEEIDAKNASLALFGEKAVTKSLCEKVFCPFIKDTFNYLEADGYVDMDKINNAIEVNDQPFELSNELNQEIKSLNKKEGLFYKLFHRNEKTNDDVVINKDVSSNGIKQEQPKVQLEVKEAMAYESKNLKFPNNLSVQNTKNKAKENSFIKQ